MSLHARKPLDPDGILGAVLDALVEPVIVVGLDGVVQLANVAAGHPHVVAELATAWQAWANRVGVIPWERVQEIYRREGKGDPAA